MIIETVYSAQVIYILNSINKYGNSYQTILLVATYICSFDRIDISNNTKRA